ncbi:transposase [Flavilitoribacter nigricans]|uniref:Transposase n=1 Tax=Flavilitoribacter nigricans (strain ATCC 23147 / DSM 23189 / NBRC 102662 / NCIMB 1420 / SS-2) TaxID=1122177 RepID=A0A2D0NHW8_FLAN2|nr:transposase [Flavilitoribacter nigricans]PHN07976.1 transposase [Flavilitoribacter nigricans DSM 23189 = NBRC 102662]
MDQLTANYLGRAESWLLITILLYFLMNGAQIFETAVVVPKWTAHPPASLQFLADRHGASLKNFWILLHSVHEITFILAIVFCWKLGAVRNGLLLLFALHFAVRVWTLAYFAPNIIEFQGVAEGTIGASDLIRRANTWKMLNYLRVAFFVAISLGLIPLYLKLVALKPVF